MNRLEEKSILSLLQIQEFFHYSVSREWCLTSFTASEILRQRIKVFSPSIFHVTPKSPRSSAASTFINVTGSWGTNWSTLLTVRTNTIRVLINRERKRNTKIMRMRKIIVIVYLTQKGDSCVDMKRENYRWCECWTLHLHLEFLGITEVQ